ncbi:histidine kinase [Streptomyces sp. NPDC005648]|uniref:sensor histidine kinase n=1 Tax=Streptomyces sp. NPDC005648 TaxID=3157044 RepID=UPI0033B7C26A
MWKSVGHAARATRHLLLAAAFALGAYLYVTVLIITAVGTLAVAGAWLLPETVLLTRRIAGAKRRLTERWTGREIPEAYRPVDGTVRERIRSVACDPGTYTDLRWMSAHSFYAAPLFLLVLPLWPVALLVDGLRHALLRREPVVLPVIGKVADREARWSSALLHPSHGVLLLTRVEQLTTTRADALTAHDAELRRVERELHDGTQARLVSLSLHLGMALRRSEKDPDTTRGVLVEAQDQVEAALTELRRVVRGIRPPILTDRRLVGAVRALAASSKLDVTVCADGLDGTGVQAPPAVESAAYSTVAAALSHAAEHSGATRLSVRLERMSGGLRVVVRDDGLGGTDENAATELLDVRRRLAALDGVMTVTSPAGGPTVVTAEMPCAW